MKKNYFLWFFNLFIATTAIGQVTYSGNGNTGFGGVIGSGNIQINDDGTTVSFTFTTGGGSFNDKLVIYIDSESGGFSTTSGFTDTGDPLRQAISGFDGTNRSTVNFPSGFTADHVIALDTGFAGLWDLVDGGSHSFVSSANLSGTGPYSFNATFSNLGSPSGNSFKFVVTYLNHSGAFRSNEAVGDGLSSFTQGANTATFTVPKSYPNNTWTGATDSDWATATNWEGGVPESSHSVIIPSGLTNYPTASSAVTISSGTLQSGASLIANDAFTGTLTYQRNLGTTNWYLVSSPFSGEIMTDMRANNSFNTNGSSEISFAPYDNSQANANDRWDYFSNTATDALMNGKGYSAQLSSSGNITFSGTMNTSDVTIALTQGGGSGNNYNLLGNPFPSFINGATLLGNESGDLTSQTVWIWDQSSNMYDPFTPGANPNFKIAPGQGFFVEANSTNNVVITEALQSHESSDTFQKATPRPNIYVNITDGNSVRKTRILYDNNASKSFDNAYDGKMFDGVSTNFSIYTQLLENNIGTNYAIQVLPDSDHENMVVPVGLVADAGKEITFTAEALNLASSLKVFLEDRDNNTFTRLDEVNSQYKITLNTKLDGIGRFYLHTKSSALNTSNFNFDNVSFYTPNKSTLRVTGLSSGNSRVKLFNVLGKQVLNTSFVSNGVFDVSLPELSTGVYIVQLENENGKLNKKIVLE